MVKFINIFQDLVIKTLIEAFEFVTRFGPQLSLSLIILFIGWICAVLLKKSFQRF